MSSNATAVATSGSGTTRLEIATVPSAQPSRARPGSRPARPTCSPVSTSTSSSPSRHPSNAAYRRRSSRRREEARLLDQGDLSWLQRCRAHDLNAASVQLASDSDCVESDHDRFGNPSTPSEHPTPDKKKGETLAKPKSFGPVSIQLLGPVRSMASYRFQSPSTFAHPATREKEDVALGPRALRIETSG